MFALDRTSASRLSLANAARAEAESPSGLLPRGSVDRVIGDHADEIAELLEAQLVKGIEVQLPEVLLASKVRGRRPVCVLSVWDRIIYRALTEALGNDMPDGDRSTEVYEDFKVAPIREDQSGFVVMADVAACYQYIDHGLIEDEIVVLTGEGEIARGLRELLGGLMGRQYGLPQSRHPSDVLADTVLSLVERRMRRRGIPTWRYSDDFRFHAPSRSDAHRALETLEFELMRVGLTANEEKTSVRTVERYQQWANGIEQRIKEVETEFEFDFSDFLSFGSEYDDFYEDETPDDITEPSDDELPDELAVQLLERWAKDNDPTGETARFGPDSVVDRQVVTTSLRVLDRASSPAGIRFCQQVIQVDPSLTPTVARYLTSMMQLRQYESEVDDMMHHVITNEDGYLSPWQVTWLLEPLRDSSELLADQIGWARSWFADPASDFVRASAGEVLASHDLLEPSSLARAFDEISPGSRPKLVAALARACGSQQDNLLRSVTAQRPLYRWIADAVLD